MPVLGSPVGRELLFTFLYFLPIVLTCYSSLIVPIPYRLACKADHVIAHRSKSGPHRLGGYHLIIARDFLTSLKMSPESALTHAEVNYREANIDSRIQKFLTESSQEHSDESFATFIMAADLSSVEDTFA
ncbi:hypothetical protein EDB87DRAFT_1296101 [Lactarius vividus]|nr:hypothetical protein EDB87DRAFT_1296101 [Lactarius vividus]